MEEALISMQGTARKCAVALIGAALTVVVAAGCSAPDDARVAELEAEVARLEQIIENPTTTSVELIAPSTTQVEPETSATPTSTSPTEEALTESTPADSPTLPTLPDYVLSIPRSFDQFRFSYESVNDLPELPTAIDGFIPFDGEVVWKDEMRLFEGDSVFTLPTDFAWQMNKCGDAYWVLRWVSMNPDVLVLASNELVPFFPDSYEPETWLLPPAAPAGIMGNTICYAPGFRFDSAPGSLATLGDIAVEWTYYDRDPFARTDSTAQSGTTSCSSYDYDDELPISVCSYGFSVEMFQQVLGVDADGYFGPGTENAVRQFQQSVGLTPDGVMNAATWAALGVTSEAPFPDLNGDGVIDGSEFPG